MATDISAMGSAIFAHLDNSATVSVYYGMAPQNANPPYGVFQRQVGLDEYTFDQRGLTSDYQVRAVSDERWASQAMLIYEHLDGIMQDGALTVTGYNLLRNRRENTFEYRDDEGFWHIGGIYRVDVWAT